MKARHLVLCAVAVALALVLVFTLSVPVETVLLAGGGAICLLWLVLLLTVPWNIYFRARSVVHEAGVSREKGIAVPADRDAEASRIATVMLRLAIGAHLGTAAAAVLAAWATGREAGYWIAGSYLLSTLFRPAGAWFGALRRRLATLDKEVRHPRDDVAELLATVTELRRSADIHEDKAEELYRDVGHLRTSVDAIGLSAHDRANRTDHRVEALSREFESVVHRLTDNQEIITGLKAFLRLLRDEGGGTHPVPPPSFT
ncbi:hypothetical protein [Streptomyces sp. NPDC051684]|uniref:hypothetical protein n=1 Tax=Streptomyces sp. NPDC051684 TaxID=3365670 RepID=UPI00378A00DE